MAYSRYATEMKDGDNNIYGLMDEEAREQLSDLKSAFNRTIKIQDKHTDDLYKHKLLDSYIQTGGYYRGDTGAFQTSGTSAYMIVPCEPGDIFSVTAAYFSIIQYAVLFNGTPSANTYVETLGERSDTVKTVTDEMIQIPSGVSYIVFNCASYASNTFTATKYLKYDLNKMEDAEIAFNRTIKIQDKHTDDLYKHELLDLNIQTGGYYRGDTGAFQTSGTSAYMIIPCEPGDVFSVTTAYFSIIQYAVLFNGTPSANTYVETLGERSDTVKTVTDEMIQIPSGVSYIVFNCTSYESNTFTATKYLKYDLNKMEDAEIAMRLKEPIPLTITQGFYNANTGAYNDSSSYKNAVIPVTPGETYFITSTCIGVVHYAIFFNGEPSRETYVGKDGTTSSDAVDYVDKMVTVPSGVSYMVVDCKRSITNDYALSVSKDTGKYGIEQKNKIWYLIEENKITVVTCYSDSSDLITVLKKKGGNNIFDFGTFLLSPNDGQYPRPAINGSVLINVSTDFMGPFIVRAVNNIDGDATTSHHFTGGNHEYTNTGVGGTPTGRTTEVKFWIDGREMTEGSGYCSNVRIKWANRVQAYNTKKIDGSGREVLEEIHEVLFDGVQWEVSNQIIPLEDIVMERYYGLQIAMPDYYPNIRFVGGPNRQLFTLDGDLHQSGDVKTCYLLEGSGGQHKASMELDSLLDLGKRDWAETPSDYRITSGMITSGTKGYCVLINGDKAMSNGGLYEFRGKYRFLKK